MVKKEKHGIRKYFGQKQKNPADKSSGSQDKIIVGTATTKKDRFKLNLTKKSKLVVLGVMVVIVGGGVAGYYYYQTTHKDDIADTYDAEVSEKAKAGVAAAEEAFQKSIETPVSNKAPVEEQNQYHTNMLLSKMKVVDAQGAADYYVHEVKPRNIELTIDTKEGLFRLMLTTTYTQETKELLEDLITAHKAALSTATDEYVKIYLQSKLSSYEELGKTL